MLLHIDKILNVYNCIVRVCVCVEKKAYGREERQAIEEADARPANGSGRSEALGDGPERSKGEADEREQQSHHSARRRRGRDQRLCQDQAAAAVSAGRGQAQHRGGGARQEEARLAACRSRGRLDQAKLDTRFGNFIQDCFQ